MATKVICGRECEHYAEEGWNELPICEHEKSCNVHGQGKYIYDYKGNAPTWCPRVKRK